MLINTFAQANDVKHAGHAIDHYALLEDSDAFRALGSVRVVNRVMAHFQKHCPERADRQWTWTSMLYKNSSDTFIGRLP